MNEIEREDFFNKCYIVAGTNNTGKTRTVISIIEQLTTLRTLVLDPGEVKKWNSYPTLDLKNISTFTAIKKWRPDTDLSKSLREKGGKMLQFVINHYQTGVLVVDDARMIVDAGLSDAMVQLTVKRKNNELITFLIFHSLGQVPPRVYDHSTHIMLFQTSDNKSKWWDKVPGDQKIYEQWINRVNERASATPGYFEILELQDFYKWKKIGLQ